MLQSQGPSIKDWLDILPMWLEFALRFPLNPGDALQPYFVGKDIVSKDLTWLAVVGIAVSYVLIATIGPPRDREPSPLVQFFYRIDLNVLPVFMILALFAFSVGLHLFVALYLAILGLPGDRLGAIEKTVNATLGFASVYIPFATLIFCVNVRLISAFPDLEGRRGKAAFSLFVFGSLVTAVSFIIYLPLSLAAAHHTDFFSMFVAQFFVFTILFGIWLFVAKKW
jgi:hypothetical protein